MLWTKLKHESCAACGRDSEVGITVAPPGVTGGELRLCLGCVVGALIEQTGGIVRLVETATALAGSDPL